MGAPCFRAGFCSKTIIPDSEEHPLASSRTVPKDVLRWIRVNTQCSAGNGYFLQNTAAKFGYSVAEFADVAFDADRLPVFGYGCAVFMETDIVNFQQLGWEKKEIMAGLAKVLPKNIWLYLVAEPNLGKFGTNFVLQGGTQHNLAAVKSQYDSSGPHHQDSGEAKIRESTAGVSRKPSSDGKARGSSSKHLCGLTAWNT